MTTGTAIPETPDQLEEAFNDNARLESIFAEGNFGEFSRRYITAFNSKNTEDVKAFKEQMQAHLQEFMRDQRDKNGVTPPEGWRPGMGLAAVKGRGPRRARAIARSKMANAADLFDRHGFFSPTAAGATEDIDNSEYAENLGRFIYATIKGEYVAKKNGDAAQIEKLQALKGRLADALAIKNASMAERVGSEGGFLVPESLRSEILALSLEDGVMRPNATVIPMDSLRVPFPAIDDTSHTSSVFGGVSAAWTAEGASLTATAPKFSRVLLEAAKLTAFTQIPNELLQDSVTAMDVWFRTFFPAAMSFFADLAFLTGDGVNQPEGVLECPGAVTVSANASGNVEFTDLAKMMARLWPPSLKRAMWVCSPDVLPYLFQLGAGVLTGTGPTTTAVAPPLWLGEMQAIDAPGGSDGSGFNYKLLGRPLRVTEKVPYPGSGTAGAISLIDPSYYLIGDRQAMQIAESSEYSFANDTVSYRVIERMDGRGWMRTPLTPANGSSNTLSPFVLLNA